MRPNSRLKSWTFLIAVLAGLAGACAPAMAAEPPALVNYEGVLRDSNGAPRDGDFDMVFRFFDAAILGNEILINAHEATGTGQVKVRGGLFNVHLGSGKVIDGGAVLPNDPYTSLDEVFRDFSPVYLEIEVGTETLTPRIKVVAAAYALNADHLDGKDASEYLDTSATPQTKSGDLRVTGALDVGGQVTIQGGSPGTGRVLTSSATGLAAWQDLPAVQINQLSTLADRLGAPDPSDLPFATLSSFDCSGANTATLSFSAGGASLGAVTGFVGRDQVSSPFEYLVAIETAGILTPDAQIGLIGRLTIQRNGLTTTFSGRITEFGLASQVGAIRSYVARVQPALSVLLRRAGYRVFQTVTMSDIINNVLSDAGIAAYSIDLSGSYSPADMVLQYNESDIQFISRLTETEGVHYHFEEGATEDRVIFADNNLILPVTSATYGYYGDMQNPGTGEEFIATFHSRTREFSATGTVGGYDFTNPTANILQSSSSGGGAGEIYEFDTNVEDSGRAAALAQIAVQRDQVRRSEHSGTGNAAGFKAGHKFNLTDHTTAGFGGTYVVTAINHFAVSNDPLCINYGNTFTAIPDSVTFRPERVTPRPVVKGPMTAVVTGPPGEEIWTDGYGRVKVQFHWDRAGFMDANSSGWIRVATPVGREDDRRYIPRIGSEVLVDFLQGDPDRPIVLGKIYNGDNLPPIADVAKIEGNSVSLNVAGPDGDQFLYFFDDLQPANESLAWNDAADRFDLTNDLRVNGTMESVDSVSVGSSLTVGGPIVGGSSLTVGGSVSATSAVQGATMAASGAITGGSTLTLPGPISLNGADITQTAGTFSFAGGVSVGGSLSSTGDLTVGGGDILAGTLNIAPTSMLALSGSTVSISSNNTVVGSNNNVSSMIDEDNNSVTSIAGWYHDGMLANLNKLAELQENGSLRVRGSLTPFVSFDLAESFRAGEPVEAGDLVSLDPASAGSIRLTAGAADPLVIGVVSEQPGIVLGGGAFDAAALRSAWGDEVGALYEGDRARLRDAVLAEHEDLRRGLEEIRSTSRTEPNLEAEGEAEGAGGVAAESLGKDRPGDLEARQIIEERIETRSLERFYEERFAPVALAGRVPVKADASFGEIYPGDALTPSPVPGVAMRASGPVPIIGTALEGLPDGRGKVLTLVHRGPYPAPAAADRASPARSNPAPETAMAASRAGTNDTDTFSSPASLVIRRETPFTIRRTGGTTDTPTPEVFRVDDEGNVYARGAFRPASMDLAEYFPLSEPVEAGDVLVVDPDHPGSYRRGRRWQDPAVVGIVSGEPGVLLGGGIARISAVDDELSAELEEARRIGDRQRETEIWSALEARFEESYAPIALSGTVLCKVDAGYGAIVPGDLLTTSPTPGHAKRADEAVPGTIVGKALEPLENGTGKIKVLVMLR